MANRLRAGAVIPEFRFDTPYQPQSSFYELLEGDKPVFLVFLRNFGHPLTRHYVMEYIKTADALRSARLVCVVRTKPATIARSIPAGMMPYELMCDAEGVLYHFFSVPSEQSKLKCYSMKALKILSAAKKQGFASPKNEAQQLPLTLLVGPAGRVLMAHYGATLTDLPEDCAAMEELAADLLPTLPKSWMPQPVMAGAGAAPVPAQPDGFETAFEAAPAAAAQPAEQQAPAAEADGFDTAFDTALFRQAEPAEPAAPAQPQEPQPPQPPAVDLAALGFGAQG